MQIFIESNMFYIIFLPLRGTKSLSFEICIFLSLPFRDRSYNILPQHFRLIVVHNENKNPSALSAHKYHKDTKKSTTENIGIKSGQQVGNTLVITEEQALQLLQVENATC